MSYDTNYELESSVSGGYSNATATSFTRILSGENGVSILSPKSDCQLILGLDEKILTKKYYNLFQMTKLVIIKVVYDV